MKEVSSEIKVNEKEKVMFPEIVVRGTKDKPYYEIKYYDVNDKQWHLGYGSYNLEYVMQWKEECLEIVEGSITNGLCEKIKERLKAVKLAPKVESTYNYGWITACEVIEHEINQVAEEYSSSEIPNKSDGWIPCSERLPEIDGKYVVCTTKGSVYCTKYYSIGEFFGTDGNTHIEAWQPLPAPYKPKGE